MTIYVPDAGAVDVSLATIRGRVNRKLRNYSFWVTFSDDGDGEKTDFGMPMGNIVSGTLTVTVDSVPTVPATIDLQSGWVTMSTAPDLYATLKFRYQCKLFDNTDVDEAINAGIRYLAPLFPVEDADETTLTETFGVFEYALPANVKFVRSVEFKPAGDVEWVKQQTGWDTFWRTNTRYLRLYKTYDGALRLIYIKYSAELVNDTDGMMGVGGCNSAAVDALVFYACWYLVDSVIAPRVNDNAFLSSEGANVVRILDIQRAAQGFKTSMQEHIKMAMASPSVGRL